MFDFFNTRRVRIAGLLIQAIMVLVLSASPLTVQAVVVGNPNPTNTPANNAPSNTFGNATATATPNPEGVYVGHGVESSIRTLLCAPSNVSSATTSNTSAPGLLNTNGTATVTNNPAANDLANCINKGYRFALAFGAVAAVFFIVIAGYMYMVGGEHGKSEAKEILISVLAGFLIMLASFVLLKQINPTLTQFRSIQPPALQGNYQLASCDSVGLGKDCVAKDGTVGVSNGNGGVTSTGGSPKSCNVSGLPEGSCPDAGQCPDCKPLVLSPSLELAASLADLMNNKVDPAFKSAGITYRIAEAMCPTGHHASCAHFNGHAVDIGSSGGNLSSKLTEACTILNNLGMRGQNHESSADRGVYVLENSSPGGACPPVCRGSSGKKCGASPIHLQN